MTRARTLIRDERGQSPYLVMASLLMFVVVSAGLAAGLIASIQVTASIQSTAQAQNAAGSAVHDVIRRGYDAVASLPAEEKLTVEAGGHTAHAVRTVHVNPTARTARVTVYVGPFTGSGFDDPDACLDSPDSCTVSTVMVTGAGFEETP